MRLLVDVAVEGRWLATGRAAAQPVPDLIAGLGDGHPDAAPAQLGTVAARAVRLVGQDPVRSGPGPTGPSPRHADAVEDGGELRAVPGVSGGDQHRQRTLTLLAGQVQFVLSPPRDRPRAWSPGSVSTPPGGCF